MNRSIAVLKFFPQPSSNHRSLKRFTVYLSDMQYRTLIEWIESIPYLVLNYCKALVLSSFDWLKVVWLDRQQCWQFFYSQVLSIWKIHGANERNELRVYTIHQSTLNDDDPAAAHLHFSCYCKDYLIKLVRLGCQKILKVYIKYT